MRKLLAGAVVAAGLAVPAAPANACTIDLRQPLTPCVEMVVDLVIWVLKHPVTDPSYFDCKYVYAGPVTVGPVTVPEVGEDVCPPTG